VERREYENIAHDELSIKFSVPQLISKAKADIVSLSGKMIYWKKQEQNNPNKV
jgi:hypothetical protein